MNKTELLAKIDSLITAIEDAGSYSTRDMRSGGTMYHLNVKMHNSINCYTDIEAIASKYPVVKQKMLEYFTENRIGDLTNQWIEDEQRYIADDYLQGCCVNSQKYYDDEIAKCQDEKYKTCYPALQKLSKTNRIAELQKWKENDAFIEYGMNQIAKETIGFYGRSGGHLCFRLETDLVDRLMTIKDGLDDTSCVYENYVEAQQEYKHVKRTHDSIMQTLVSVDTMRKGMNAQLMLEERVENWVYEYKAEIKEAIDKTDRDLEAIKNGKMAKELREKKIALQKIGESI